MSDLNVTSLTGRLVRDPELRHSESGKAWGTFTLAANYHFKDEAGAFKEEVAYVACKVLGPLAQKLAGHKKGEMAVTTGRLRTETWKKDGQPQSQLVLICDQLFFVMPQRAAAAPAPVAENGTQVQGEVEAKDGKPPF